MIYLLEPLKPWEPWFDCVFGLVVIADTMDQARELASTEHGDEGPSVWLSCQQTSCKEIGTEFDGQASRVVLVHRCDA